MQLSLLAQMLGVPQESLALKDEYERAEVAEVRNRDEYLQAVRALGNKYEKKFEAIEKLLRNKGLVQPGEAEGGTLRPKLLLQLEDRRTRKEFPLPSVPSCYPYSHWADEKGTILENDSQSGVGMCEPPRRPQKPQKRLPLRTKGARVKAVAVQWGRG
jgi:hypothetical protein